MLQNRKLQQAGSSPGRFASIFDDINLAESIRAVRGCGVCGIGSVSLRFRGRGSRWRDRIDCRRKLLGRLRGPLD